MQLMIAPTSHMPADVAVALLIHYSFDQGGYTVGELIIDRWSTTTQPTGYVLL